MRIAASVVALLVPITLPTLAAAKPVTAGVSFGTHHDKVDSDGEGNRSLGLFGRVGLARRLSAQLEIMKIETDEQTWTPTSIRVGTLSLRLDLVDPMKSRLVPTVSFGAGFDRASTDYDTTEGHHFEGGVGLEYRAEGGFNIGIDLRFGGRSVEEELDYVNDGTPPPETTGAPRPLVYDPGGLREGEYRAIRVTAGIAF
jgi:Outer membrane protein beta-barrel domain